MDSIHQAKLKSGHLLHKMALVQSQRNSTVIQKNELVEVCSIRFDQHWLFCISTFQKVVVKTINFFNENQVEFLIIIMQHSNHNLKIYRGALLRWSI